MQWPRLQLVELEDLPWWPASVRDCCTDYLEHVEARFGLHRPAVPILRSLIEETGVTRLVDLCSGGGGPVEAVVRDLVASGIDVRAVLTDRYPNLSAFRRLQSRSTGRIECRSDPVDARDGPGDLPGIRTIFNAFHHFAPEDARRVLGAAVAESQPIAVLEIPDRTMVSVLHTLLAPFMVLAVTPWIRPFRWRRIALTYVLPLVPLTCLWDGVVSQLRAYTGTELDALARGVDDETYEWTVERRAFESLPLRLTTLVGRPRR